LCDPDHSLHTVASYSLSRCDEKGLHDVLKEEGVLLEETKLKGGQLLQTLHFRSGDEHSTIDVGNLAGIAGCLMMWDDNRLWNLLLFHTVFLFSPDDSPVLSKTFTPPPFHIPSYIKAARTAAPDYRPKVAKCLIDTKITFDLALSLKEVIIVLVSLKDIVVAISEHTNNGCELTSAYIEKCTGGGLCPLPLFPSTITQPFSV
jgi:hypothetical protein